MAEPHIVGPRDRSTVIYDGDGRVVAAARDPYVDQIAALPLLLELAHRLAGQDAAPDLQACHELARDALGIARVSHPPR